MVFSVIYQTQTCINLGSIYTSSHTLTDVEDETIIYSCSISSLDKEYKGLNFDTTTGDFTIEGLSLDPIDFTITVQTERGTGYNIPIHISIIDETNNTKFLQYTYQTGYSFSAALHLFPTYFPEDENENENENENYFYSLVGAPAGISIDSNTGQISGNPINYGKFIATVYVLDIKNNTFICSSSLHFMIYNSNILTELMDISPNNEIIHSNNLPFTLTCNYIGAPPSNAQSLSYKISSPCFINSTIINYVSSDFVKLTFLVSLSNLPGRFPIVLTDTISGFFITSPLELFFTTTAACFNEDTTILCLKNDNNDENTDDDTKEEKVFKCINEIKVGDYIETYKHGLKKVTHIGSQQMVNNPDSLSDCMYKQSIRLSKNKLAHDLTVLGRHSLLVDKLTRRQQNKTLEIHAVEKIDDKELLITMFNEDFDTMEDKNVYTYYHLVLEPESDKLDRRYGIYVNGSTDPETLKPGVIAATSYKKDFIKQFK
jgi:hypothetical protein